MLGNTLRFFWYSKYLVSYWKKKKKREKGKRVCFFPKFCKHSLVAKDIKIVMHKKHRPYFVNQTMKKSDEKISKKGNFFPILRKQPIAHFVKERMFTSPRNRGCVIFSLCVCLSVCPSLLVNKIRAARMHRFGRCFR